jgi:putative FmdB family regulatory protein
MPSYAWICPACGHKWEVVCAVKDRDEHLRCPECSTVGEMDWSSGEAPVWHFKEGLGL